MWLKPHTCRSCKLPICWINLQPWPPTCLSTFKPVSHRLRPNLPEIWCWGDPAMLNPFQTMNRLNYFSWGNTREEIWLFQFHFLYLQSTPKGHKSNFSMENRDMYPSIHSSKWEKIKPSTCPIWSTTRVCIGPFIIPALHKRHCHGSRQKQTTTVCWR